MATVDDRGQLLLVGAFVLATALIALTLVLTASNYTTTVATQSDDVISGEEAIGVRESIEAGLTAEFRDLYVRDPEPGTSRKRTLFRNVVAATGVAVRRHYANHSQYVSVSAPSDLYIEGSRLKLVDPAPFTLRGNPTASPEWYVRDTEVRNMTLEISQFRATHTAGDDDDGLSMTFESATGGDWQVELYRTSTCCNMVVKVTYPDGSVEECDYQPDIDGPDTALIDLEAGTIDGVYCRHLGAVTPAGDDYDLHVQRGDRVSGQYWMLVDKRSFTGSDEWEPEGGSDPDAVNEDVLYGARVRFEYYSSTVSYDVELDIAPDELS